MTYINIMKNIPYASSLGRRLKNLYAKSTCCLKKNSLAMIAHFHVHVKHFFEIMLPELCQPCWG